MDWPQEPMIALAGTLAVREATSYPPHTIPVEGYCVYPRVPAGLPVMRHGGVVSLPGTNNLRALLLVKYLVLFLQGWVNSIICSLFSFGQRWKRDSSSG